MQQAGPNDENSAVNVQSNAEKSPASAGPGKRLISELDGETKAGEKSAAPKSSTKRRKSGTKSKTEEKSTKVTKKRIEDIKKLILAQFRPMMTWDYMRMKRQPHGCECCISIPGIGQNEFCALVGLEDDPELKTLTKKKGFFVLEKDHKLVMGEQITGKGGKFAGNSKLGIEDTMYMRFYPKAGSLKISAYVGQGFDN